MKKDDSMIMTKKLEKKKSFISNISSSPISMMEHIIKKEKETRDNIKFIKKIFEKLVYGTDTLVEVLIKKFSDYKAKNYRRKIPDIMKWD